LKPIEWQNHLGFEGNCLRHRLFVEIVVVGIVDRLEAKIWVIKIMMGFKISNINNCYLYKFFAHRSINILSSF